MSLEVDRNELLALALSAAEVAGKILQQRPANFELSTKSVAIDFATQMDKASEKAIVDLILAARPNDGIVAEEGSARESTTGITWVIDPLDGTVNYFYGLPGWNVSIAAQDQHGSIVGVVYAPTINSLWHGVRDGGAFLNNQPIRCTDHVPLNRALLGTGFQYDVNDRPDHIAKVSSLLMTIRDIRRNGAAAVDLCFVAMGSP
jgi:myo-inositol-1(or 4)-monophosphatase